MIYFLKTYEKKFRRINSESADNYDYKLKNLDESFKNLASVSDIVRNNTEVDENKTNINGIAHTGSIKFSPVQKYKLNNKFCTPPRLIKNHPDLKLFFENK